MINDVSAWTEAELQRLINQQEEESLTLEYKRSDALGREDREKNEMAKDVSAFANSDGGVLIYGIEEENHKPVRIDEGVDPAHVSREMLEDTIHGRVRPRLDGLKIKPIDLAAPGGTVAYAIWAPQSLRGPHMAGHRYYKRFNFKAEPMEDYEVRDVMRRQDSPALTVSLSLPSYLFQLPGHPNETGPAILPITVTIANNSPAPAEFALVRLWIDTRLEIARPHTPEFTRDPYDMHFFNAPHGVKGYGRVRAQLLTYEWKPPRRLPIWLEVPQTLEILYLQIARTYRFYGLRWQVHSPRMAPNEGTYTLHCSGAMAQLALPEERIVGA